MNSDLISRADLKKALNYTYSCAYIASKSKEGIVSDIIETIDNVPTVSFMISTDYVTELENTNKELIKQLEDMEVSKMKDKIKQAVKEEFVYRASEGRINYSMEEVIYIVNEVIDEVFGERCEVDTSSDSCRCETDAMSKEQLNNLDMQMGAIKCDLQYLSEKVNKLSSLLDKQKVKAYFEHPDEFHKEPKF